MPNIKGGYYLKARQIKKSAISTTSPCTREVWDYLLREANFADSKTLNRGQLTRSYKKIIEDLSWFAGVRRESYENIKIKKAMAFLRKHKMILTKRVPKGILITICNYKWFQDKRNYESTNQELVSPNNNSDLEQEKTNESTKTPLESTKKEPTESTTHKNESINKSSNLQEIKTNESTNESTKNQPTIDNNNSNKIISNISYNIILPDCLPDEIEFERDRRLFYEAFPGVKTFQLFDDNSDRKDKRLVKQFHINNHMPAKYSMRLEELNEQGAGVYLCINETNGKGRTANDIVKVRAVWADFDGSPLEPVWEHKPSIVCESSPGKYHAYWLVAEDKKYEVPLESFRTLQESISEKFNSDPKVKDLPRVMRVPGFNHMKSEPFQSRLIHYELTYFDFGLLVEKFPPILVKQWSAPKYQKNNFDNNSEFKGQYGCSQGNRNNHVFERIGGAKKRGLSWTDIEQEAFKECAACSPPLSQAEAKAILKSFRRYA